MIIVLFTILSDIFTHLIQSVKKWGLSACTITTSKKSLQFFPTMCVIPLSLCTGKEQIATEQFPLDMSQSGLMKLVATVHSYLHEAEGTVGDKEQFLSLADQSMQNGVSLLSSQNKLICEGGQLSGTVKMFYVQKCAGLMQKEEEISYWDPPWPICTCSLWGEPCQSLPEDYSVTQRQQICYTTLLCYAFWSRMSVVYQ